MRSVIWLQIPTVSWLGGGTTSLSYWMCMGLMMLGRPKHHSRNNSAWTKGLWVWVDYWKAKNHKLLGIYQIPAEFIKAAVRTIRCEIHKYIIPVWNKEELPEEWKESTIVRIYKRAIKQNVVIIGNYWGSSKWIWHNRSTADHIFCIRQILEKKINTKKQCIRCL